VITKEEVILAYRLMLGRDPENEDVVNSLCQNAQSSFELRDVFIRSPEFKQRMSELLQQPQVVRHRHPFTLPKIPVEIIVVDQVLNQMFERIRNQWELLGSTEPFWSVITQPQYYKSEFDSFSGQFYLSGKQSCQFFLAALRRSGISTAELNICLEVGCGVGRVTNYLALEFSKVIAADISSSHIALAKEYLDLQGISNTEFVFWKTVQQLTMIPTVDVIFSVITLQHNPPPVMAYMLSALLGRLRSGGVAYIQIPTYRNGYIFESERYLNTNPNNSLEMHFLPQSEVFKIIEFSHCRCLEIREDAMVGEEDKMLSNTFLIQRQ